MHFLIRNLMRTYWLGMRVLVKAGPRKKAVEGRGFHILLTGHFFSHNWARAHLLPLSLSPQCKRLRVVTTFPIPRLPKIEVIRPPDILIRMFGATPARLMTFVAAAMFDRPDVVGGFHLLMNGMLASLLAKMIGVRSLYFCVGGPAEILDGGLLSENRLFGRLKRPDPLVEKLLLKVVSTFDVVVVMGNGAARFFRERGARADSHILSGGIDLETYHPREGAAEFDLIYVGRLVPIKRLDLLIEVIRAAKSFYPAISACVIGDGPLLPQLTEMSLRLGLQPNIKFLGYQPKVAEWLRRARIFILTSVSEGLSLAMMEAMASGLPAIVPATGDLVDLVNDQENGYLISDPQPEPYARRMLELLTEPAKLSRFSISARASAERYSIAQAVERWNRILDSQRRAGCSLTYT